MLAVDLDTEEAGRAQESALLHLYIYDFRGPARVREDGAEFEAARALDLTLQGPREETVARELGVGRDAESIPSWRRPVRTTAGPGPR